MKSFVMTCVFLFSCGLLAAEDMKFVTLRGTVRHFQTR